MHHVSRLSQRHFRASTDAANQVPMKRGYPSIWKKLMFFNVAVALALLVVLKATSSSSSIPPVGDAVRSSSSSTLGPIIASSMQAVTSRCDPIQIHMSRSSPKFPPRFPKKTALESYRRSRSSTLVSEGVNSVKVDDEDLKRAEENVIRTLPVVDERDVASCSWSHGAQLLNAVSNFVQETALDGHPIVLDYGCVVGTMLSKAHSNATVICLLDDTHPVANDIESLGRSHSLASNLLWVHAPLGIGVEPFAQLYSACNFVTAAFVLFPLDRRLQSADASKVLYAEVVHLLIQMLPSTATTIVALPSSVVLGTRRRSDDDDAAAACTSLMQALSSGLLVTNSSLTCEAIGSVDKSTPHERFDLFRLVLSTSIRGCRKTWGAPLIQWDRSQKVVFRSGEVTFKVESVASSGKSEATTMRVIHPLQYIHSLNLDTLLGAGLSVGLRQRLLGQMIRTPRYSDPLPHNWVVAGGGEVQRIDKVDLRYDRDVDESKGYWGHSTAGYLHLLTYHLCLQVSPNGLPKVAEDHASCRTSCRACARLCSYLPKGTTPCSHCLDCGRCIEAVSVNAVAVKETTEEERRGSVSCQKKYPSMHKARSVWKLWEKADKKHSIE